MTEIQFLWDEEKTRKLFKTHLILFTIGGILASIYTFFLPPNIPYHSTIIAVPILFTLSCFIYFFLLNKVHPGYLLLFFTLEAQAAAAIFMAVTGGFLGIVQFAPFMFLVFAVFELGADATFILGVFSVITFLGILIWSLLYNPTVSVFQQMFYYVGSYILILIVERNIGKEISLQFQARKKLEQIDDLKNQFMTLSSHYLRTPLTVIKAYTQDLAKTALGSSQKADIEAINTNVKELELLIEKMLIISAVERGQVQITAVLSNMNLLIDGLVKEFQPHASKKGIMIHFKHPDTPIPDFYFDNLKLKQVIANIIDNAIQYNKDSGTVGVTLSLEGSIVTMKISDTGVGISRDHLSSLFTTFNRGGLDKAMRADVEGTGLGLYLAKLIIEAHKGRIYVNSQEGQGTIVVINLPLVQKV